MNDAIPAKVPAVTLGFWIIKILATTLGETGGDTLSMTFEFGYLASTAIFATLLVGMVCWQIAARRFHPLLYWGTIIASTTAGTTLADFADRSLGLGYVGGTLLLVAALAASLAVWKGTQGSIAVDTVTTPRAEGFYWLALTLSQTLGTALGDWAADAGLGYLGAALLFGAAIALVAIAYRFTRLSRVALFWLAFVLTRPLGATVGDFFDKPLAEGGLDISRPVASAVLAAAMLACVLGLPQRPATR
jgi:uncharacterized membrane-anchored protein